MVREKRFTKCNRYRNFASVKFQIPYNCPGIDLLSVLPHVALGNKPANVNNIM